MSKELIRENGKIKSYPYNEAVESSRLSKMEFPKHVWITREKENGEMQYMINYYIKPHFDCPDLKHPNYWMLYENEFDTPERLLHQLAHMLKKRWFTTKMADEVMHASQQLYKKINGKDMFWWNYREDFKIYNLEK